jgi:two-component system cell cycle response regulator DivK
VDLHRALIVDDNSVNQELLSFVLESDGFEVRIAARGEEALELLDQFAPDLMIVDVQLPGLSGLDLINEVRGWPARRQPCIIVVTSYAMANDRERAMQAGCDGYIPKPIDTRTFAAEMRRAMAAREAACV